MNKNQIIELFKNRTFYKGFLDSPLAKGKWHYLMSNWTIGKKTKW